MIAQICASAFSEVENGLHLVPEGVEPQPRLPGEVPGLVHHPPLRSEQVLLLGAALEVAAVGEEEQRLGEVRLVEARGCQERAVERPAARHQQQVGHQRRHRSVVPGRELQPADDLAAVDRVPVGRGPGLLLRVRGALVLEHRLREAQVGLGRDRQRAEHERPGGVDRDPHTDRPLDRDAADDVLPGTGNVRVGRSVGGHPTCPVELGDRRGEEVLRGGARPLGDRDGLDVGRGEERRQQHGQRGDRHDRDHRLLHQVVASLGARPLDRRVRRERVPGRAHFRESSSGSGGTTPRRRTSRTWPAIRRPTTSGSRTTCQSSICP
jgi:hypothetical protein